MPPALTAEQIATFGATMRRRAGDDARRLRERRDTAWGVARQAADVLRARYGATRVIVFGSLADGAHFSAHSDIDLAARGLAPSDHYAALERLFVIVAEGIDGSMPSGANWHQELLQQMSAELPGVCPARLLRLAPNSPSSRPHSTTPVHPSACSAAGIAPRTRWPDSKAMTFSFPRLGTSSADSTALCRASRKPLDEPPRYEPPKPS